MPYFFPACIADSIWWTLLSRIRARIAGVHTMISAAITRPRPFSFCSSVCVSTPSSTKASWARICDCWCAGKTSMMRLMLSIAELVCSGERQVARLGDGQRGRDRLQVAHFADQHDVGVLAQRVLERRGEARRVGPDLALVDDAALMAVDELDGILDRDDVPLELAVDLVDHGGEGRALARPGGARHEHQPAGPLGELRDHGRQAQLLERLHVEGNLPDHERHAAALLEAVAAESGEVLDPKGEVE